MSELHGLFAYLESGKVYRIGKPGHWRAMVDRWYRFDDTRLLGARKQRIGRGRNNVVRYFAVRSLSDPDPRWSGAIPVRCSDVKADADAAHTITYMSNKAWRATAKHCAILTAGGDCSIGYGPNPLVAASDARSTARRRGLI